MNSIVLVGRLTKDVEIKETQNGKKNANFTLAVQRKFKNQNGEYESDFFNCIVFNENLAVMLPKFIAQGSRLSVQGSVQITNYQKDDGSWVNYTSVVVSEVGFIDTKAEKPSGNNNNNNQRPQQQYHKSNVVDDEVLPF